MSDIKDDPDKEHGLYPKYRIERLGDTAGKHRKCSLFVLDLHHDPLARTALETYISSARAAGYNTLAYDLSKLLLEVKRTA